MKPWKLNARQRHRDPIVAAAILHVGTLLACLLPLAVCIYLLRTLKDTESDGELCHLLVEELVTPDSQLRPLLTPLTQKPEPQSLPASSANDAA